MSIHSSAQLSPIFSETHPSDMGSVVNDDGRGSTTTALNFPMDTADCYSGDCSEEMPGLAWAFEMTLLAHPFPIERCFSGRVQADCWAASLLSCVPCRNKGRRIQTRSSFGRYPSGALPLILDEAANPNDYTANTGGSIGGSPQQTGSFQGSSINFDIVTLTETTVVPVPAAAWLFGSGLLGLVGVARRKKA